MTWRFSPLVIALLAVFSACGQGEDAPQDQVGPDTEELSGPDVSRTFRELTGYGDQRSVDHWLEDRTADCMDQAGFVYVGAADQRGRLTLNPLGRSCHATHGFGIVRPPTVVVEDPNEAYYRELSADDRNRFDSSLEQCEEATSTELVEVRHRTFELLGEDMTGEINGVLLRAHPELVETYGPWSDCMAESDVEVASPLELIESIEERAAEVGETQRDALLVEEVRLATAYFDCHQQHSAAVYTRLVQQHDADIVALLGADGLLEDPPPGG